MISGVIIHLANDMPILCDMDELPSGGDRMVKVHNVRTLDGKRPAFVHDKKSTFVFPLHMIRLMEVPILSESAEVAVQDEPDYRNHVPEPEHEPIDEIDEEAEEDLLARIRSI